MNQIVRNLLLIFLMLLAAFVLPAWVEVSLLDLPEEDDLTDEDEDDSSAIHNFSPTWIRIPVHQMSVLLRLGISIFALFVVYLGGRSKHRRFNDRTIDPVNALTSYSLKTALFNGAVFYFLCPTLHLTSSTKQFTYRFIPTLILNSRRLL